MEYLPEGYEELRANSQYLSFSKLTEGEHRFRIVQRPIAGWVDWKDNKPYRYKPSERPANSFDAEKPMRAFWACYVWDYSQQALFVVEVTQSSILKALTHFGKDEDWGDFTNYDIKIAKSGSGKETKYHVSPVPHKKMSEEILSALKAAPVNLEALYQGGDPWQTTPSSAEGPRHGITQAEATYLDNLLENDPALKENILNFLESKGFGKRLIDMPSDMYDKMVDRAIKNTQERQQHEQRVQKENAPMVPVDFGTVFRNVSEEAYPF